MSDPRLSGNITGTGATSSVEVLGRANILIDFDTSPGAGTVVLERSFDDGSTFSAVSRNSTPAAATYTTTLNATIKETEKDVLYRFNCTAFTSGTIIFRISI